ncbi:MAG: GNAT family N-acetyltransferase [Eubacteriaceae bacterium]|nr:GNAT family N-acetyltransferase [Eubacteriaceae bacterium]
MKIEKAQQEDLEKILELQYLAYQSEAVLLDDFSIPPLTQTIESLRTEYGEGIVLKAVGEKGDIIGSVRAYIHGNTAYIGKLMVHPQFQGQGIGTELMAAIELECQAQRYELYTSDKSIRNIKLYERLGYKEYKREAISEKLVFVYLEKL